MGSVLLRPDYRDYLLSNEPDTRRVMAVGIPNEFSLRQYKLGAALNQGARPSCVSESSSHMQMLYQAMERRLWPNCDAGRMYTENGGDGTTGVDSRRVLQYMQDQGVPLIGSPTRYKIKSYAFVDFSAGQFAIDTMKAAIAAGRPCVLAMLLPSDFNNGMTAGLGTVLGLPFYHQVLPCFFFRDAQGIPRIGYLNSWGESYGEQGFGSVPESYLLLPAQRGFVYAYTTFDAADEDLPTPTPNPTPTPTPQPLPDVTAEMLRLVQQVRAQNNLPPFTVHPALMAAAGGYALLMGTSGTYSHTGPDGSSPWDRMQRAGFTGNGTWGENIAAGQTDPSQPGWIDLQARDNRQVYPARSFPGGSFTDWMNSPGHRGNILNPAFTHIGVGYAHVPGSQYGHYWVQDFSVGGGPQPTPTPTPIPTPVPVPTPTPATVTVGGVATGVGMDGLALGQTLSAQGAGFVGEIRLTTITRDPRPQPLPDPQPQPEPGPTPPPGSLEVKIIGTPGSGFISYAHSGGAFVAAALTGTADGVVLGTRQSANNIPARWLPGRGTKSLVVDAAAIDGRTGRGQWP